MTAIFLYIVAIIIADARKIRSLSAVFHWQLIPTVLLLILTNYFLRAFRFHFLLRKINIRFHFFRSLAIFFSGIAMTATPGKIGEVVKSYLIKQRTGHGYAQTIPLLIFERVLDGMAMIILSLGGIYLFPSRAVVIFFIVSIFLTLGFFILVLSPKPAIFLTRLLEKRFRFKLRHAMIDFFDYARVLINLKTIGISLILSLAAWALQGIALYILIKPFIETTITILLIKNLAYALFIFSFTSIAAFLAFIPAGLGVAEGSLISFLILFFHLNFTQAVFISLVFRATTLWFGVGTGMIFLVKMIKFSQPSQSLKD